MIPVTAPADKRFRRAHVRPGRKRTRSWSPRMLALVASAVLAGGYATYLAYDGLRSPQALTVAHITVHGNTRMSSGEIAALMDGAVGVDMMTLDLDAWRLQLLRAPWVADAAIRRLLPATLDVAIEERRPMGVGRLDDALYLIDETGTIIDEFGPNYAELDLPVIDGLVAPRGGDSLIESGRAALAARLLVELQRRPDLSGRISQIDVSDERGAVLILKDDATQVRVGDNQFVERLQSYLDLAPTLRERVPDIEYVDLRFDDHVYVRPRERRRSHDGPQAPGAEQR